MFSKMDLEFKIAWKKKSPMSLDYTSLNYIVAVILEVIMVHVMIMK